MSLRLLAIVALLLAATSLSSAPLPFPHDRGEADLMALQGEWTATRYQPHGTPLRTEDGRYASATLARSELPCDVTRTALIRGSKTHAGVWWN